jgi:hypothetical protein
MHLDIDLDIIATVPTPELARNIVADQLKKRVGGIVLQCFLPKQLLLVIVPNIADRLLINVPDGNAMGLQAGVHFSVGQNPQEHPPDVARLFRHDIKFVFTFFRKIGIETAVD